MATVAKKGGASGAAVGWTGELQHTPLAEVLRRIVLEERSGDLRVTSPPHLPARVCPGQHADEKR
jgi:hypothetical protein